MIDDKNTTPVIKDQLDPKLFTSGVIVWDGMAHLVTIYRSHLVMDTEAWALALAHAHERDARTTLDASARALMVLIARNLRLWAQGDHDFLESATNLWQCSAPFALRAKLGFTQVTDTNYADYMSQVMTHTTPALRYINPTFLFVAQRYEDKPALIGDAEIYVTQESAHFALFAAKGIYRSLVTKRDLLLLYDEVLKDFSLAHER